LAPLGEVKAMAERQRKDSEAALDAFLSGRWADARELCNRYPKDGAAQFLLAYMDQHPQGPPAAWKGVIVMEGK
jgi:hypothetical protein